MYANLKKELFAKNVTQVQLAKALGIGTNTLAKKMHGKTEFKASEMMTIKRDFFPEMTLEYLFNNETK